MHFAELLLEPTAHPLCLAQLHCCTHLSEKHFVCMFACLLLSLPPSPPFLFLLVSPLVFFPLSEDKSVAEWILSTSTWCRVLTAVLFSAGLVCFQWWPRVGPHKPKAPFATPGDCVAQKMYPCQHTVRHAYANSKGAHPPAHTDATTHAAADVSQVNTAASSQQLFGLQSELVSMQAAQQQLLTVHGEDTQPVLDSLP